MRNLYLILLLFCAVSLSAQNIKLKLPTDLYYSRTPGQNKRIKFKINNKIPAINLISTDNQNSDRLTTNSVNRRANGRAGLLLAIPKLYKVAGSGATKTFSFGQNGGENNNDDADVTVRYQNGTASTSVNSNDQPVSFRINNGEVHTATSGNDHEDLSNTEQFLKVTASTNSTATIEINRKSEQGNCIVAIFDSKNGDLLGTLNPKDPENSAATLSLTVDKDVYVIPFIRPKVTELNGKDLIIFEVGDPEENGSAESEEE